MELDNKLAWIPPNDPRYSTYIEYERACLSESNGEKTYFGLTLSEVFRYADHYLPGGQRDLLLSSLVFDADGVPRAMDVIFIVSEVQVARGIYNRPTFEGIYGPKKEWIPEFTVIAPFLGWTDEAKIGKAKEATTEIAGKKPVLQFVRPQKGPGRPPTTEWMKLQVYYLRSWYPQMFMSIVADFCETKEQKTLLLDASHEYVLEFTDVAELLNDGAKPGDNGYKTPKRYEQIYKLALREIEKDPDWYAKAEKRLLDAVPAEAIKQAEPSIRAKLDKLFDFVAERIAWKDCGCKRTYPLNIKRPASTKPSPYVM